MKEMKMHSKTEPGIKEKDWRYLPPKQERLLSDLELAALERALTQHQKEQPSSSYSVNAIRFLLYTGCRLGEALTLRWESVYLEDGYIDLKDTKVGTRIIPLNDKVKQILISLHKQEGNPYVFCGKLSGMHLNSLDTTWRKVRILAGIPDVRLYDLRYSFANLALKKGVDFYTVYELLGHKDKEMPVRLVPMKLEYLKEAANKVAQVFG